MSTTTQSENDCSTCNKSTLSFLLLRPSLIAKDRRLAPIGAASMVGTDDLVAGLVPARKTTESRHVLRLLREGYVHVYIPKPPPGMKSWFSYLVTQNADLIAQTNPLFNARPQPPACTRDGHNAHGMRLMTLPNADKITDIWLAYSANAWSDKLKAQNAANPKAMQHIVLRSPKANTFKPTGWALQSQVMECAMNIYQTPSSAGEAKGGREHDFAFNSLSPNHLADQLQRAAANHPTTKGLELAIVLADPVGYAAEANALRLRRYELAKLELEKPEVMHPMNSSNTLLGLKKMVGDMRALNNLAPLITKKTFDAMQAHTPERTHDATWEPVQQTKGCAPVASALGRFWRPYARTRYAQQAEEFGEIAWKQVKSQFDEEKRQEWRATFDARMNTEHLQPLERFELDWLAATTDACCLQYFALHFDENDANNPKLLHSPGEIYAQESAYIHGPQPLTTGSALTQFLILYEHPVTELWAVALRAMVGNQKTVIEQLRDQLLGDPNEAGMRDKTVDFLKGLLSDVATDPFKKRYSWLSSVLCKLATGSLGAYSAAGMASLSVAGLVWGPQVNQRMSRLMALSAIVKGLSHAFEASLGKAMAIPVLLFQHVSLDKAAQLLGHPNRVSTGGSTMLALLTDTEAIKAAGGNVDDLFRRAGSGAVTTGLDASQQIGHQAGRTLSVPAETVKQTYLTKGATFDALYVQQQTAARALAGSISKASADAGKAILTSLDGKLGLASVIVQSIGLVKGLAALETAEKVAAHAQHPDDKARADAVLKQARLGLYDSMAGLLGGLMDVARVGGEAMSLSRQAAGLGTALPKNVSINMLRFGIQIVGMFGGALNAYVSLIKAEEAKQQGEYSQRMLYIAAFVAFGGTGGTSFALASGVAAEFIVARQVGSAAVQRVATQVATRVGTGVVAEAAAVAGAATFAGAVATTGVILLGLGIIFQIGAAIIEPSELQKWARRTYFGHGPNKFAQPDWKAEHEGLLTALGVAVKPKEESAPSAPAQSGAQQCPT
jgi:hypothetical protein